MLLKIGLIFCCLVTLLNTTICFAEDLQQQWNVGQAQISPKDLVVTTPLPSPEGLSLQDAIAYALRYNIDFRSNIQSLLNYRSVWLAAKQRWELTLSGSIVKTHTEGDTERENDLAATVNYAALTGANFSIAAEVNRLDDEENQQTLTITAEQPLLRNSGKASDNYEEVRSARNAYRNALLSYYEARQSLVAQVIADYFDVVQQQQLTDIQEASVKRAEQSVQDAQLRLDAGMIPEIDLTRAQLRLANARNDAVSQQQSLADARDQLLLTLGLQVDGKPQLITVIDYEVQDIDLDAEVKKALEQRPEIKQAELAIENSEAALHISRSNVLPELNLFGSWEHTINGTTDNDWNLGLSLSVPVASRPLAEAIKRAQWDLLLTKQSRENLKQEIITEVRRQVRAAQTAKANVDIAAQSVDLAKRSLHFAQRMVEEGLRTNRDLLDSQDDLTSSEINLVTNQIDYYLALIRLKKAVGLDLIQDLSTKTTEESTDILSQTSAP